VCRHVEKARIELLIAGGASHRSVGVKFGLSHYSIGRHWKHTPEERKVSLAIGPVKQAALAARACEESESVLDGLKAVRAGLWEVYSNAVEASDKTGAALLAGRLHENYNSIARLTGQIMSSPMIQNNTVINNNSLSLRENAEYELLQARILHVLEAHPDALRAVIAELERANNQALPALEHHGQQEESAHAAA
jgi:hypothetical protein